MMKALHTYLGILGVFTLLSFMACKKGPTETSYILEVPDHFPTPPIPADNPLTEEKVELGRKLFFDPILSADNTVSCASCHLQANAFSDPRPLSEGVGGVLGRRHAMALINLVYENRFFWDGANPSLEEQAIHPIIDEREMAADISEVERKLNEDLEYPDLFDEAFGEGPSVATIVDALASYERILISSDSPYDRYLAGDDNALSESAKRGLELFNSEQGECFHCHTGFNFTDGSFQNNGLYEEYADEGRKMVTGRDNDLAKFKTPTLRNVEFTAPYMHDGSMATLEEVVAHYASRGKPHPNRSIFMLNITLNEAEQADLVNFLKSLSDESFLTNPEFRP